MHLECVRSVKKSLTKLLTTTQFLENYKLKPQINKTT